MASYDGALAVHCQQQQKKREAAAREWKERICNRSSSTKVGEKKQGQNRKRTGEKEELSTTEGDKRYTRKSSKQRHQEGRPH
jgi:hypothetical protein